MQIDKLPKGYVCDEKLLREYARAEAGILPFLKKQSHKVSSVIPTIDFEDALQEGRSAVIVALVYFDESKGDGRVGPYVWRVVKNAYYAMVYEALTKCKVPYVNGVDADGNSIRKPAFPISLDTMLSTENGERRYEVPDDSLTPDDEVAYQRMRSEVGRFTMKMYNALTGIDYDVFTCKVHPAKKDGFLNMLYMEGVNFVYRNDQGTLVLADDFDVGAEHIGKYLGMNKNAVGWSLYKIRKLFLEMARYDKNFIGLFNDMVIDRRWPMVHMVKGTAENLDFEREVFQKRCLNPKQTKPSEYAVGEKIGKNGIPYYSRLIKWYEWGAVVTVKRGKDYYTIIAEGRFNPLTGAVFGAGIKEAQEHIPLNWYRNVAKGLRDA